MPFALTTFGTFKYLDKNIFQRHANVKLKCFLTESYLDNQKYNLLVSVKNIQRKKHFNH